jgi:ABC-2 type transport system ATP-binding protein
MTDVIRANGLVKSFGGVRALDGLTLDVRKGELYGLLGPNGAGKSTFMSVLCGLQKADEGSAAVLGMDILRGEGIRSRIGVCPQSPAVFPYLSGQENVELFGDLNGLARRRSKQRGEELLQMVGLTKESGRKAGGYSEGMKRRLSLAMALVNDPEIAFLDEPTVAMDPQSRRAVWAMISQLQAQGKTVVLSTHYMEEAQRLCDRIGIIDNGRLIAEGTAEELMRDHSKANLEEVFVHLTGRTIREGI